MPLTIVQTFGLKTGDEMDKYFKDGIRNDDINRYGWSDSRVF